MPSKARYWANPEHHKAYARARDKQLIIKGLKGHELPTKYARHVKQSNLWNKSNREKCRVSNMRYWRKLAKEAGSWSRYKIAEVLRLRREAKLRRIREACQML